MSIQPFGKSNETRVRKFEADLGLTLPPDYRDFLLQNNGALFRGVRVWSEELERWVAIDCFFGLELEPALDLRAWAGEMKDELPPDALVIGSDPFCALLVLGCSDAMPGVYLYDHAHQIDGSDETRNAYRLADSWSALDDAMAAPAATAKGSAQAARDARDHAAEDQAFTQKPVEGSFWVPGGIDQAKANGKVSLQIVDRLKQARFTHQSAFAI